MSSAKRSIASSPAAPHLALISVQLLFATWPIVGKLALRVLPALTLVGFRVAGAALVLLVLARATGRFRLIARKDWPLLIVSSVLGLILNQWLFVTGLSLTTAINSTLICTTIPISTLLIGLIFGTDRIAWRRTLGIVLAMAGVILLIGRGPQELSSATRTGDLFIVANSLCYGAYIAISKDLVRRYSALNVITWVFIVGTIATIPVGAISIARMPLREVSIGVWLAVAYVILMPTAVAYFLNAWALARVPPSTVAVYIYLQPLFAFALAPLVLGEPLGARAIVSSLMIFVGVVIVTRRRRAKMIDESQALETI